MHPFCHFRCDQTHSNNGQTGVPRSRNSSRKGTDEWRIIERIVKLQHVDRCSHNSHCTLSQVKLMIKLKARTHTYHHHNHLHCGRSHWGPVLPFSSAPCAFAMVLCLIRATSCFLIPQCLLSLTTALRFECEMIRMHRLADHS